METQNKTIIKSGQYVNTYILQGKPINTIIFYNNAGVIFQSRSGWLEREEYPTTIDGLELTNIKKALKPNYTKTNNYFIPSCDYLGARAYDLYIYTGAGGDIQILEDYETLKDMRDGETWFTRHLTVKTNNNFYVTEYKKNPNAIDNYGIEWIHTTTKQITITQHARIEKTPEKIRQEKVIKEFNKQFNTNIFNFDQLKNIYEYLKKNIKRGRK